MRPLCTAWVWVNVMGLHGRQVHHYSLSLVARRIRIRYYFILFFRRCCCFILIAHFFKFFFRIFRSFVYSFAHYVLLQKCTQRPTKPNNQNQMHAWHRGQEPTFDCFSSAI